jgi:protoporphyrinogen oxidase
MDKEKVKRTASPYILFCSDMRPIIKKEHPDATFGETGKFLGKMWEEASEKLKATYTKKAEVLKVEVLKEESTTKILKGGKDDTFDKILKIDAQIATLNKTKIKLVKSLKY